MVRPSVLPPARSMRRRSMRHRSMRRRGMRRHASCMPRQRLPEHATSSRDLNPASTLVPTPAPPLPPPLGSLQDFLNDSLVDFEIKFMQMTIPHPVNLERCHIFNSFFYKRLLHAMGGGKLTRKNYDKVREGYQSVKRCAPPPPPAPPSPLLSHRTITPSARVPFPARIVTWLLPRAHLLHA